MAAQLMAVVDPGIGTGSNAGHGTGERIALATLSHACHSTVVMGSSGTPPTDVALTWGRGRFGGGK